MKNPFRSRAPAWGINDESDPVVDGVVDDVVQGEVVESRSMSTWMGGLAGYNIIDPLAIPPPGTSANHNWAGVEITPKTMLMMDAVSTAMRIISNGVMELGDPMAYEMGYTDDNWPYKKILTEQPAFITNTFGDQIQYIGQQQTVMSMALFGSGWWYVIERLRGLPSAVEVLNPALLEIRTNRQKGTIEYWYGAGVDRRELNQANLIHIPHKIMPGALTGMSSLDYAGISTAIALAAMEYGARWFSQSISPGYMLTTDAKLGQDEVQRILQQVMYQHAGLSQAHIPMIIDSGLKPQKNQTTPDESQYLQTLEYCRSVVASYFGIPASLLGNALQKVAPAPAHTVQEESIRMMQWTLSGYIVPLEQTYAAQLQAKTKVAFNRENILRADAGSFAQLVATLTNSNVLTSNEIRARYFDMAPHPDGDELVTPLASNTAPGDTNLPTKGPVNKPEPIGNK